MWRRAASAVALLAVANAASADPVDGAAFFPMRPANAKLSRLTGVLTRWSHGESVGTIAIRDAHRKTHVLYMGFPPRIDGKVIRCFSAPTVKAPDDPLCQDWPANVVLGVTKVKALYWVSRYDDRTVHVSDEVDTP